MRREHWILPTLQTKWLLMGTDDAMREQCAVAFRKPFGALTFCSWKTETVFLIVSTRLFSDVMPAQTGLPVLGRHSGKTRVG